MICYSSPLLLWLRIFFTIKQEVLVSGEKVNVEKLVSVNISYHLHSRSFMLHQSVTFLIPNVVGFRTWDKLSSAIKILNSCCSIEVIYLMYYLKDH